MGLGPVDEKTMLPSQAKPLAVRDLVEGFSLVDFVGHQVVQGAMGARVVVHDRSFDIVVKMF